MSIMKIIGSVLVVFLLVSNPVLALYKWTDKNNVTHYDQFPPKNQKSQEIQMKPQKTPDKPPKSTPASKTPSDNQTSQDKAKNTSTSTNTAAKDKNCAKARQNLQILSNNKRIRIKDNGNYRILPESERQRQINGLNDQINSTCQSTQKQSQQPR